MLDAVAGPGGPARYPAAILLEQNDEWQLQHRHMTLETMAGRGDEPTTALLKAA